MTDLSLLKSYSRAIRLQQHCILGSDSGNDFMSGNLMVSIYEIKMVVKTRAA